MNKLSKVALLTCYFFMLITTFFFYPKWEKKGTEATISWDVSGYYLYLPAIFIYKDIKHIRFNETILKEYYPTPELQQAFVHPPSGNYIMKYSSGQAVMMSPFFFIAHAIASYNQSPASPPDGYSFPYQICIGIGMFLYALLGLFFLRKILLVYFSDPTVALVLVAYVIGTNYLNYTCVDQAMTHNPLFTLYTLVIFLSIQFYERQRLSTAIMIGALGGLATITRPTDIIILLLPIFWGVASTEALKGRLGFILHRWRYYLAAILAFLAVGNIQLCYWKYVSGNWLIYSYEGQTFSWLSPHILDYAFSYRCGWLLYCPMMMLPFLGIFPFLKSKQSIWVVVFVFLLDFYIVCAWDVWDYGLTAGRAMVQCYPVIAFPFAALIEYINKKKWLRIGFYAIFLLFIYLNIWWTWNSHRGSVTVNNIPKKFYWSVVGRWSIDDYDKKLLDNRYSYRGTPSVYRILYENDFEKDSSANAIPEGIQGRSIILDKDKQDSQEYFVPLDYKTDKWVRVFADFKCEEHEPDMWKLPEFHLKFYNGNATMRSHMIKISRFIWDGETKNIFIDAKLPPESFEKMSIAFFNKKSEKRLTIDNLKVITFKE